MKISNALRFGFCKNKHSMSEFKFSCPACGQNVLCDNAYSGTEITCPTCHAAIVVPQETAQPANATVPTDGPPPPWTGYNATGIVQTAQRTSGLAIASLVCSLSSLVTCVGWLPGIICGHLAKSRIRRNSRLKGQGLATTGLIIGYLILMLEAGTVGVKMWRFSAAMKQGYENVRSDLATNQIILTTNQFATIPNIKQPVDSAGTGAVVEGNLTADAANSGSEWTADINAASFPDHGVSGKFHGMDFTFKTALFRNGTLKISSTEGMVLEIFRLGPSITGQDYEVQPADDDGDIQHVKMTWNEGDVIQSATFNKGCGMKLHFDEVKNRKVAAKIYLCFPDDSKSYVTGSFEVRLARPKAANP
jgi:DNA-directed RNA polymerase subunit RPC12/RpoP